MQTLDLQLLDKHLEGYFLPFPETGLKYDLA